MVANKAPAAAMARPASDQLRLEVTALPTRVERLGTAVFGWRPVATPMLTSAARG